MLAESEKQNLGVKYLELVCPREQVRVGTDQCTIITKPPNTNTNTNLNLNPFCCVVKYVKP